jgi:LysR family glycine cleavage system transcriptional activator
MSTNFFPPLYGLRAFESASRTLSFTRTADELNVTPAAVSHQIKTLEERLGIRLLERQNNKLTLTTMGEAYIPSVREALDMILAATDQICMRADGDTLRLSVLPIFATRWLIPRLGAIRESHPELNIEVSTSYRLVNFNTENIDAGVRYGSGQWPGLESHYLFGEEVVPMCNPILLQGNTTLSSPTDLRTLPLLHSARTREYWRLWLTANGIDDINPYAGYSFSNCLLTLEAARAGLGVAMINRAYLDERMANGSLVAPFDMTLTQNMGCYLVYPKTSASFSKILKFRDWVLNASAETSAPFAPVTDNIDDRRPVAV